MRTVTRNIFIAAVLTLLIGACGRRTEFVVEVGEKIHHDDFDYSVSNFMITRFLKSGKDTLYAKGMFYIIRFRVDNNALRVNHVWNNDIAFITDEKAGIFENIPEVQEFIEKTASFGLSDEYITKPASADSTILVFDLPYNAIMPYLKVRGNILAGDILNGALFRRVRVKLF